MQAGRTAAGQAPARYRWGHRPVALVPAILVLALAVMLLPLQHVTVQAAAGVDRHHAAGPAAEAADHRGGPAAISDCPAVHECHPGDVFLLVMRPGDTKPPSRRARAAAAARASAAAAGVSPPTPPPRLIGQSALQRAV